MVIKWKSLDLDERAGIKEKVGDENVKHVRVVVVSGEEDDGKKANITSDKCGNGHFFIIVANGIVNEGWGGCSSLYRERKSVNRKSVKKSLLSYSY